VTAVDRTVRWILSRGPVRAIRTSLRDAWWTLRGRRWPRPALPGAVHSLLFVCKGNICRSPFASERAAQRLAERGRADVVCASGGYAPSQAAQSPAEAVAAAAGYGVALGAHRPSGLTEARLAAHDLVVVFEVAHYERLRASYPAQAHRLVLLPLFGRTTARRGYARYNLADPFGRPRPVFDDCYREIADAVDDLLDRLPPVRASS
jgi:protein-tyrosine-phosphatase